MLSHFNSPVVTNMQDLTLSLHLDSESRRELEIEKFSVFFGGGVLKHSWTSWCFIPLVFQQVSRKNESISIITTILLSDPRKLAIVP